MELEALREELKVKQEALKFEQSTLRFEQGQHKQNAKQPDADYLDLVKTVNALESQVEGLQGTLIAAGIRPRPCKICNGNRRPAADKMSGVWWMTRSRNWQWRCEACGFVGDELAFLNEAAGALAKL